jgi:hypothetical protein
VPGAFYPLLVAFAGFAAAALLSERGLSLLQPDAKASLMDTFARTRLLNLLVIVIFVPLVLWRPLVASVFLGLCYIALGTWAICRLLRLDLPAAASRLLLTGQIVAVAGIVLCALIFALRTDT